MTTRMVHPEHGATHAYSISEIEWHQKLGWRVDVPTTGPVLNGDESAPTPDAVIEEQLTERDLSNSVKSRYGLDGRPVRGKPGRPPKAK